MTISVENVKVEFRGARGESVPVLDIERLDIPEGSERCLTGGSGSGKTTLLNIMAGIVLPNSGAVRHDDVDITGLSESKRDRFRAENVGYVFQTFNLIQGLSATENVMLSLGFADTKGREARTRAEELLDRVGLSHRRRERPGTMSVGEQQRVAIARAVANRPRVVLADEPTANLDETTGDEVLDLLREATSDAGSILLIVTHDRRVYEKFSVVTPLSELTR